MLSGSAKEPSFNVPQHFDFLALTSWQQQPSDWLGEGFAVKMDTEASDTPSPDWRYVLRTPKGSRDVFFVETTDKLGVKNASSAHVQERFLALQAAFVRYAVHANFPFHQHE